MEWKDCTLTAVRNQIYADEYTAKYRYNNSYIEIEINCCTYYLNSESIESGEALVKISELDVQIPQKASSYCWDDSNKSFFPLELHTNGNICLGGSGTAISIQHWISLSHVKFIAFY